ncbi:hypothetical protein Dimus_001291, partial [Dionaea muscipula]
SNCKQQKHLVILSGATQQHVWRPKRHQRNTIWQRVPVNDKKHMAEAITDSGPGEQTPTQDLDIVQSETLKDFGTTPAPHSRSLAESEKCINTSTLITAEPESSGKHHDHAKADEIRDEAKADETHDTSMTDDFQKVQSKRQRKSRKSQKNPEHHQDKPTASSPS